MTTISRPVISLPKTKSGSRKVHTLHHENTVFTIQKNGTSVISFRNKSDAIHFGKMLEGYFDMTHMWPYVDFDETILYKVSSKTNRFKYLYMKYWEEDDLRDFCIKNSFGMLDIFSFEDDRRLVGNAFSWEVPMNYYVESLNERLNEPYSEK